MTRNYETKPGGLARRVGPQHVTVQDCEEVAVISAEDFRRLKGERSGAALIAALRDSPHRDIEIAPPREKMPVRRVER